MGMLGEYKKSMGMLLMKSLVWDLLKDLSLLHPTHVGCVCVWGEAWGSFNRGLWPELSPPGAGKL